MMRIFFMGKFLLKVNEPWWLIFWRHAVLAFGKLLVKSLPSSFVSHLLIRRTTMIPLDCPKSTQSLKSHANQSLAHSFDPNKNKTYTKFTKSCKSKLIHSFDPNNIKICFDNFIIIWAQRMWIALKSEEHYFLNFVYF